VRRFHVFDDFYVFHVLWGWRGRWGGVLGRTSYRPGVRSRPPPAAVRETSPKVGPGTHASASFGDCWELIRGDCRDVLPLLPAGVFDACVTDPPYGLGMAAWDREVPGADVWTEVLRVMKPGAALVAFGGRRTYHRMATAVEDAGFRVVDQALWIFRTGRPPTVNHLRPGHESILVARAPGRAIPVNVGDARIPWRDDADRSQVGKIDSLRATGRRRPVYEQSLDGYGREAFVANDGGRWPSTVMATDDEVLGEATHAFLVPKIKNALGHPCSKPVELLVHLVKLFVPEGGVLLDPFAGGAPLAPAVKGTGRRAVLIEAASEY
jgi:DNA modification methylase